MKILIPEDIKGKELFKFLVENKSALIAQKKSLIKHTEAISCNPVLFNIKDDKVVKAASTPPADAESVRVKVVGNSALWCDTQLDVLLPDSWKRSIKERKGMMPHLHDHIHEIGAEVGDVRNVYSQDISLTDLGLTKTGTTQALIWETDVKKVYNPMIFEKYRTGKIKQHSIGLQYVKLELAINDPENEKEYDFWNKYISQVLNPDVPEEIGFFWVVSEIKVLENSAVLFGSNILTPTLEVKLDTLVDPELASIPPEPSQFDLREALKGINFFKN